MADDSPSKKSKTEWTATLEAMGDTPGTLRCNDKLTPEQGPVCVTGASGFIALHLLRQLLEKGYTVVGTVRKMDDPVKMAPLKELQDKFGAEKLKIVGGVDCLKAETFDEAVKGCVGVFHTASPFHGNTTDPMKDLVEPAVKGTQACLEACKRVGGVRRVVVTSSFACIFKPGAVPWDYTYTSKDWNTVSVPNADGSFPEPVGMQGYRYSKIAAEKAAWDFQKAEDCPFDVTCICPPLVIGHNYNVPKSISDLNTSSSMVLNILIGKTKPNPNSIGWVDVADVAKAHIYGYEHPEAGGRRFICAADTVPLWTEIAEWLKELYPAYPVITDPPEGGRGVRMGLDCAGLKALSGFEFKPLKDSLKVQIDSLVSQGFAKL